MKVATENRKPEIREDVWIPTQCRRCMGECAVLAHRVNGIVVKLEGNPDSPIGSKGGLCPKGAAGLQVLYDPNRLKAPLRRTNPEKGIGVDPKWQEVPWDEALDEIAGKLKKTMEEDPSKIMVQHGIGGTTMLSFITIGAILVASLGTERGMPTATISGGANCGNAGHFTNAIYYGGFVIVPDWKYTKYSLVFGTSAGYGGFMQFASRLAADALERGMKLVVFDPVCNNAASKATEWVPLVPGTDAAVILAMLNVIVNELGVFDAPYLKQKTNAAYLIGRDGRYVRDKKTGKPMVWDTDASAAKAFDDPTLGDLDLDGKHEVEGTGCRPAWILIKDNFRKYPPERSAEISGVPAATIRRIAKEFADAAMVGATIVIDGRRFPLRPVSAQHIRGGVTHHNATHTAFAIETLLHVVGAANVPGGQLSVSVECHGYPSTGRPYMGVKADPDGLLDVAGKWLLPRTWPMPAPRRPLHKDLTDLFPMAIDVPIWAASDRREIQKKAGVNPDIDVLINYGANSVLNASTAAKAQLFKEIPFIVDFDIFPTEFNEGFADIVLPDTCYLEQSDWAGVFAQFHTQPPALDEPWCFHITQKVVEPQYGRRHASQVVIDILQRVGLGPKVNAIYNSILGLNETLQLKPDEKIVWDDLCDRVVKHHFGTEHDWEWFKKHGSISWPKKAEEVYWKPFKTPRIPLYWEFVIDIGERAREIGRELGIELDWQQYDPLPQWFPNPPHLVRDPRYDLYCFCYRDTIHGNSYTMEQPWLDEASSMNPYTYSVTMNAETARKKGLEDGDVVELESDRGRTVQGVLKTREGQHPQTIAMVGTAGHWAKGQPIARGKGVNFNALMDYRLSDCDPLSLSVEPCIKVKVRRVKR